MSKASKQASHKRKVKRRKDREKEITRIARMTDAEKAQEAVSAGFATMAMASSTIPLSELVADVPTSQLYTFRSILARLGEAMKMTPQEFATFVSSGLEVVDEPKITPVAEVEDEAPMLSACCNAHVTCDDYGALICRKCLEITGLAPTPKKRTVIRKKAEPVEAAEPPPSPPGWTYTAPEDGMGAEWAFGDTGITIQCYDTGGYGLSYRSEADTAQYLVQMSDDLAALQALGSLLSANPKLACILCTNGYDFTKPLADNLDAVGAVVRQYPEMVKKTLGDDDAVALLGLYEEGERKLGYLVGTTDKVANTFCRRMLRESWDGSTEIEIINPEGVVFADIKALVEPDNPAPEARESHPNPFCNLLITLVRFLLDSGTITPEDLK